MSCSLAGQSMLAFLTWHLAGVVPNLVGIRTIGSNWDTDAYFMIFLVDEIWGSWTNIHCNRWVFEILETSLTWWLTAICISMIESFRCWELTTALALSLQEVGDPGMPLTVLSLSAAEQRSATLSSQLLYQPGQWLSLRTRTILTQAHMMAQMDAVLDKSRLVNGKPTSLAESAS